MSEESDLEAEDGFKVPDDAKSSTAVLTALTKAEGAFRDWQTVCDTIDAVYSLDGDAWGALSSYFGGAGDTPWQDSELDLFWASYEVMKPAVYARAPQPVVSPLFKDGKRLDNTTAEFLERASVSVFKRTNINDLMCLLRDDVLFTGRGTPWMRYEGGSSPKVCAEYRWRRDFLYEPTRTWEACGWVAAASWMTRKEMRERFSKHSGDAYLDAKFELRREKDGDTNHTEEERASTRRAKVWEVWHKADNRVYWVTDGVDVFLDDSEPYLEIEGFFPCPRPAFGTLRRGSLIPTPDWLRYQVHFSKISELTRRIYSLLNSVRMKGLIPAGGSVGDAVEALIRSDDDSILIPVEAAAMMQQGATGFVAWLPLAEIAAAIQGLIEARAELIRNFYELSGISDIMRGDTEAQETLGAQELKAQYGSIRVREKSMEMQRIAADMVNIAAQIIAQKFPQSELEAMTQMDLPTRSDINKQIKGIEKAAEQELRALATKAQEMAEQMGGQVEPGQAQQAQQQFIQEQQQITAKYAQQLAEAEQLVAIEDVMKQLRDDRTRSFVFEIESSSTILTDELQEKRSRNEFMAEFAGAQQALMGMAAMGEPGAKLAGAMMKFVLAPYRVGRELDGAIDAFIDAAPEMAAKAAAQAGQDGSEELAAANQQLAEAEMQKAQAAIAKVQADSQLKQADNTRKMAELQLRAQNDAIKAQMEQQKLEQQMAQMAENARKMEADIDKVRAETYKILVDAGLAQHSQALNEFKTVADVQARESDQLMKAEGQAVDAEFRARGEERSDRQQDFSEQQAMTEAPDA